ncbi:MAG TPA: tRNA 2-thiouridine(34) synthase MnmA [Candidatus Eisenbacteria bacterium]|nr:tRNA 2-thiouridine(34) synthase MnmA [Candidatus Eisenbacteria bacterium]
MTTLRVLAAMSGGVDSAVAAALLAEQGHTLTGITLKLWCYGTSPVSPRACCTLDAIDDARRVAVRMGFTHHVVEAEEVFRARVLQPFLDAYAGGRTPYPCALCNQHLKFGDLVERMELIGADRLATGHYARVETLPDGTPALYRAADRDKDQSYALATIPYAALSRVIFPLGALDKAAVRGHAARLGLAVWDKPESQDLCFVPDGDYAGFMVRKLGETRGTRPGPFVDLEGRPLGTHRGIIHYTVGQRRGLGVSAAEKLYVVAIDAASDTVTLGPRRALDAPGLVTEPASWLMPAPVTPGTRALVQIRYHHAPAPASLHPREDGSVEVRFDTPQSAVTPGQACVFYDGDRVLGGAAIAHALRANGARPEPAPVTAAGPVTEPIGA